MPRNEEGEFELILGNKQLLTVFFIIVVLLGIFATMGYIVGRSTVPSPPVAASSNKTEAPATAPLVVDPLKPSASPAPEAPPAAKQPDQATPPETKVVETKSQAEAKSTPPAEKKAAKPAEPGPMFIEPAAGQTFLQVAAVAKADAEIMVGILRKKNFPAAMAIGPSEKEKIYRVLVGPLKDTPEISKTRADLEAAGFKGPYLRKY